MFESIIVIIGIIFSVCLSAFMYLIPIQHFDLMGIALSVMVLNSFLILAVLVKKDSEFEE